MNSTLESVAEGRNGREDLNRTKRVPRSAWVAAWTMMIIYAMNFLDRQLVATLAKPITEALHLSDAEFGLLTGLFFVTLFAVFGIPAGWLVDRVRKRVRLVSIIYGVWSVATVLTGMAQNFVHMAFARALCGIGEGGGTPTCVPIVADHFPPERRGVAFGIYNLGVPLGLGLGTSIAAGIAATAGWRHAFFALGIFGVLMAIALPFIVREPKRGFYDKSATAASPDSAAEDDSKPPHYFETLKLVLFKDRPLALALLASAMACVVFYGFSAFMVLYLMRIKGMSMSDVALWIGPSMAVTLAIAQFGTGWWSDHFAKRRNYSAAYGFVCFIGPMVTVLGIVGMLLSPTWPWATLCAVITMGGGLAWMAPFEALIQNRVRPNQRGVALATYVMIDNFVGQAVGPSLVGAVSTWYVAAHAEGHLSYAIAVVLVPLSIFSAACFLALWYSLWRRRDGFSISL